MSDPYVEVIGKVEEANVIMMLASTDLGSDFSKQMTIYGIFNEPDVLQLTRTLKITTKLLKHRKPLGYGIYSSLSSNLLSPIL
jgi:hypothetical protein